MSANPENIAERLTKAVELLGVDSTRSFTASVLAHDAANAAMGALNKMADVIVKAGVFPSENDGEGIPSAHEVLAVSMMVSLLDVLAPATLLAVAATAIEHTSGETVVIRRVTEEEKNAEHQTH